MSELENDRIRLDVTVEQADTIKLGLELLTRIGLGQLEHVSELVRMGVLASHADASEPRPKVDPRVAEAVEARMDELKVALGYARDGSYGVGHVHLHPSVNRAYEINKVLRCTLANHRNPNPEFRNVDYDGLSVRYTRDPAPVISVVKAEGDEPTLSF